ncbi:Phosphotransferase enzyme [Microsporum canis]|uniref:Altered inheritance of mitochondria protein 9, mitochondrial n=1 Tax=Arthroderma otae (strain ATCC MYA-4605 / CBS 113480) TaxID=554155 RepID=C5FUP3_ARTOC|nr:phosphotransferase family protein [Microsporum canis CBS 113480]EEQ33627.1 phosphotransferase family protein [Microsporum canis CBS 113480]
MKVATILQRLSGASPRLYRNGRLSPFSSFSSQGQSFPISTRSLAEHDKFFQYTSGRWVWDEEKQLKDRFAPFNVMELQRIAAESIGANKCISMTKLAEGSYNKTFYLIMDNGSTVIARIPHPIAGPKYYTTASEVATMDFARTVLQIPVPRVHAWSARVDNPVGAEYIIMEEASGAKLEDVWDDLSLEDRIAIMKDLVSIESKLLSVSFSRYGNLYYSGEAIPGAMGAEVVNDTSTEIKRDVKTRFSIGPAIERDFWTKERSVMDIDRGPWHHPQEYVVALARREQEWIKRYAIPKAADDPFITSAAQNSPEEHLSLLENYLRVAPYLLPTENPELVASTIWHSDLHAGNLFVEKGRITGVIDWQEAWAGPLVLQGRHPRLVDYHGDIILKPPPNFKDLKPHEKILLRRQIASSIIVYLYERQTAKVNPRLNKVLRLKLGRVRCEPICFISNTWDGDILPLRESLIKVERYWDELGFNFACPIHFTQDELQRHVEDGEGWNEVQDFWRDIEGIVTRDGWTPHGTYDEAAALFSELREIGLRKLIGKERRDFDAQTRCLRSWKDDIHGSDPK